MKAKFKDKLAILAITGVLAVTLTACNGYYAYDYQYGNQYDYKGSPAYGYRSGYYPHMYDWYSQPLLRTRLFRRFPLPLSSILPVLICVSSLSRGQSLLSTLAKRLET